MLLRYLFVIGEAPVAVMILLAAFAVSMIVGLAFHEFAHAYVATRLGDGTPKRFGRLTLDPRAHLDPVGSLMILFAGFGWAKPTPVNANNTANPRRSMVMIAAAGPLSNLAVAALAAIPIRLDLVPFYHPFVPPVLASASAQMWTESVASLLGLFLGTILLLNVMLAVFNLLPIAPLDGFKVVAGLLPPDPARSFSRLEAWGPGILLLLFMFPFFSGGMISPLSIVMSPLIQFFLVLLAGDARGLLFG